MLILAAHKTGDRLGIGVNQFAQHMYAQVPRSTGQQHVAQTPAFALNEGIQRILLQQVVQRLVIKIRDRRIHSLTLRIGTAPADQFSKQAGRRMIEQVGIGYMLPGFLRLDDHTGNHQRGTSEFEEVIGSTHLVERKYGGKDICKQLLGIVGRLDIVVIPPESSVQAGHAC